MTLAHDQKGAYIFGGKKRNIYSKFIGRIKLKESDKEEKNILFSDTEIDVFMQPIVKKYIMVADPEEECYEQPKIKVEAILREQYKI